MIAFGTLITKSEPYRVYARPGIEKAAERDSEVFVISSVGTVGRGCNLLLDTAAALGRPRGARAAAPPHRSSTTPSSARRSARR